MVISPHCAGTQQQVVVFPLLAYKTYEVNIIREFPIKYGFMIEATIMCCPICNDWKGYSIIKPYWITNPTDLKILD
jgi:hypothetical protein